MNARIIAAALVALVASAGAAQAEIAPSYDADGICSIYALPLDTKDCANDVDAVSTGSIAEESAEIIAPNAAGYLMPWAEGEDGFLVEVIRQ